ncbi:MAG: hypothetical protein HY518_00760 [Candidatus Aenigmarchaeota archaeon]|nr:hypothetical protein [Candidatus Aenigmarchaeota archaeon]
MEKGIALISGILFLAITITAVVIIYQAGVPVIKKIQAASVVDRTKAAFAQLDSIVQDVASGGKGSQRSIFLSLDFGKLKVDSARDEITWELNTDAPVVTPRSQQKIGNLVFGANLDVSGYNESDGGTEVYVLENARLKVSIRKLDPMTAYSTSQLLFKVHNKDINRDMDAVLDISVDGGSSSGDGFTTLETPGDNLPYATVSAFMDSSSADYYINFTLESGADFLTVEGG